MANENSCNGDCDHCPDNVNPIQVEFREKFSALIEEFTEKIKNTEIDEIDIANDLISEAALLYSSNSAPISDAIYCLARSYEEDEEHFEEIAMQGIDSISIPEDVN